MKKTFLSIAIVLASLMGTSTAFAQTATTTTDATTQRMKGDKKGAKEAYNPFEGLNLSEKQQSELKALRESCKAERTKLADKAKADQQKVKAEKQAEMKQMKEQRMKAKKDYLAKIKGILTADQYVQFLENSFLNQQSSSQMGKRMGQAQPGQKGMKQGKDGQKNKDGQKSKNSQNGKRGDRKGGPRGERSQQQAQ